MSRAWTNSEIQLLGTKPDFEIGRLIGRPGKAVWAKRNALGIISQESAVHRWTDEEDGIIRSHPSSEAAKKLNRTLIAVRTRARKLGFRPPPEKNPDLLSLEEARLRIEVSPYDSTKQEEKVRFVGGPYTPQLVDVGGRLRCKLRGMLTVAGYTNALIPWPVAVGNSSKQVILCGDLLKALKTESCVAVAFHFGLSPQTVSLYRSRLGIERFTPGSRRLLWRNVELARTDEARAKMSRQREGRRDLMTQVDRERLRAIQKRPKSKEWKDKMTEHWQKRFSLIGRPEKWTKEELEMIGTRPDREVAKLLNRSLMAVKAKKFQFKKS